MWVWERVLLFVGLIFCLFVAVVVAFTNFSAQSKRLEWFITKQQTKQKPTSKQSSIFFFFFFFFFYLSFDG